jgi:hypothetical protein
VTLLLDLLKTYTVGSEILIANHPGLKTEDEKKFSLQQDVPRDGALENANEKK